MATAVGAPAGEPGSPVGGLPLFRTPADVIAGRIRFKLAGEIWTLPVLDVGTNEDWVDSLDQRTRFILADIDKDDLEAMASAIMSLGTETLLGFLYDYDKTNVLPREPEFRRRCFPFEFLWAVWQVSLAANPTVDWEIATALDAVLKAAKQPSETPPTGPTKASPRRMAGRRAKSGPN